MALARIAGLRRHLRLIVAWALTLSLVAVYLSLPDGDEPRAVMLMRGRGPCSDC